MKTPTTAKQLNAWVEGHFHCLHTSSRGYILIPTTISVNGETLETIRHITMITLMLKGFEDVCVTEIGATLANIPTREEFQDATSLLFIRSSFEYVDGFLRGRLAFYSSAYNKKLMEQRPYKAEGAIPLPALVSETTL